MNDAIRHAVRGLERQYKDKPDEAIIQEMRTGRRAAEALFYLLFGRYADMLRVMYAMQSLTLMEFDDFMLELDIRLSKDGCAGVRRYRPEKASFKTYLSAIARNLLYDLREKELPTLDADSLEDTLRDEWEGEEVMSLIEEINSFPDKDSRYVLLKTIEGYKSKEIAAMLTGRKREEGALHGSEELKPSYIDTLRSRALKSIRRSIMERDKRQRGHICCSLRIPSESASACDYMPHAQKLSVTHPDHDARYEAFAEELMPPAQKRIGTHPDHAAEYVGLMPPAGPLSFGADMFVINIMKLYRRMKTE